MKPRLNVLTRNDARELLMLELFVFLKTKCIHPSYGDFAPVVEAYNKLVEVSELAQSFDACTRLSGEK